VEASTGRRVKVVLLSTPDPYKGPGYRDAELQWMGETPGEGYIGKLYLETGWGGVLYLKNHEDKSLTLREGDEIVNWLKRVRKMYLTSLAYENEFGLCSSSVLTSTGTERQMSPLSHVT
jgi:hypothetical protein